jgi:hypothetical protein
MRSRRGPSCNAGEWTCSLLTHEWSQDPLWALRKRIFLDTSKDFDTSSTNYDPVHALRDLVRTGPLSSLGSIYQTHTWHIKPIYVTYQAYACFTAEGINWTCETLFCLIRVLSVLCYVTVNANSIPNSRNRLLLDLLTNIPPQSFRIKPFFINILFPARRNNTD